MIGLSQIKMEKKAAHLESGVDGIAREVVRKYKVNLKVQKIGPGLRFVHHLVDHTILSFVYFVLFILMDLTAFGGNEYSNESNSISTILIWILLMIYPLYYTLMEYFLGQTVGKMATGHVVINNFANRPALGDCILRTLIRFVPFHQYSCLGSPSRGWHDRWTNTFLVKKEEIPKLREILRIENNIEV